MWLRKERKENRGKVGIKGKNIDRYGQKKDVSAQTRY